MTLNVWVPGDPKGQPRPRARAVRNGLGQAFARVYEAGGDHPIHGWKDALRFYLRPYTPKAPMLGPVEVHLRFRFKSPASNIAKAKTAPELKHEWNTSKPDCDNLAKAVLDVMTELGFWRDDSQVVRLVIEKRWALNGWGCNVTVAGEGLEEAA